MRKVFIGCGIVVLVVLGGMGFLAYKFAPHYRQLSEQWQAGLEELAALESRYPFEPGAQTDLDHQRFAAMLDLREGIADYLLDIDGRMQALGRPPEGQEAPGFFDQFEQMARLSELVAPIIMEHAARLDAARMSGTEFAWHTRVMWAALRKLEGGADVPSLEPLVGSFDRMKTAYEESRRFDAKLGPIEDLLTGFPPGVLADASAVMAQDVGRVERGLRVVHLEHFFMASHAPTDPFAVLMGTGAGERSAREGAASDAGDDAGETDAGEPADLEPDR